MLTNDKTPRITNWFSSLRRTPKKKNDKKLQKSCLDLSRASDAVTLVTTPKPASNISPKIQTSRSNDFILDTPSIYSTTSTSSLTSENDRNLCTKCCRFKTRSNTMNSIRSKPASIYHGYNNNLPSLVLMRSPSPQVATISSPENYIISSVDDDNGCNQTVVIYNKKEEFSTTTGVTTKTTTTVTRTTLINKQALANGDVQLLSSLENSRKFLLSQLQNKYLNRSTSISESKRKRNGMLLSLGDDEENGDDCGGDLEYIDDDSNTGDIYNDEYKPKVCSNCKTKLASQSEWNICSKKQIKDELCEVVSEMETLDSQDDCKHSNSKDKQMSIGRKKFNMDPKKGIEYLVENHLLRMDPQDVADFLYKGEGLNKTAIGDYLGEKNDFNEQVLKAFVELHDFTNLILVQALRQFLWSFRLPGEAQKIDRMMECFAQRYCQLNPDIFTNTDTCYVLSFAIIMLNTSLHNPSVKDKPGVEQFISMNRGINNGGDLPRELLESLYESIRTEPFKIPQDDGNDLMHTFFNPDKEGWLWKQGGRYKSWKRRWFILNDNCLYYFEYTTDKEPRGIIPLENISVREIQDRNKPHCFELFASGGADIIKACKTDSEGKVVEGKHTVYRMSAATEDDKQEWIKCLSVSISHNPFYDILVQRKKKALINS